MDNNRKKELKELYKQMKPEMGVFIIRANFAQQCHLLATASLKGTINRVRFQLNAGSYPQKVLQRAWKEHGEAGFTVEVLEKLEYDRDETKTDYSEELAILKMLWVEKLLQQGLEFY